MTRAECFVSHAVETQPRPTVTPAMNASGSTVDCAATMAGRITEIAARPTSLAARAGPRPAGTRALAGNGSVRRLRRPWSRPRPRRIRPAGTTRDRGRPRLWSGPRRILKLDDKELRNGRAGRARGVRGGCGTAVAAALPLRAFIHTYKPVLDDAAYRAFDTMQEYRSWCDEDLPDWLGYGRV